MNTEKNVKIALHIGMQKTDIGWFDNEEVLLKVTKNSNTFDDLKFDTDWNWLLAVVSHLSSEHDRDNDKDFDAFCYNISDAVLNYDLERAYNNLVVLIKVLEAKK